MNYLSSLYISNDKLSFYKGMTLTVKTNLVAAGGLKNKKHGRGTKRHRRHKASRHSRNASRHITGNK